MSIKIRLSIMMFLQFFVWGVFWVPLATYLGVVFKGEDNLMAITGNVYSTQPWAAIFAPFIVGFIADRLFNKERINGVLQLIGAGVLWWCSTITESPTMFYWGMMAFFLCYMPSLALVNAISFQNLDSVENEFPKIRLWGTIGWIMSGLVISQSMFGLFPIPFLPGVTDAGSSALPLRIASVVGVIYGLYCFTLPASPPQATGQPISFAKILGLDAIRLLKRPSYAVFALCSFLICIPLAFYFASANDFIAKVSFGDRAAGVMALGQVSELFFMALVPFFLRRLGVKMMMIVGMIAWAVRYGVFGLVPLNPDYLIPASLIFGVVLHGVCYDFFFVTGQLYTDRVAPREIRTSAQALLGLVTYGSGMLVGSLILGRWGEYINLNPATKEGWMAGAQTYWLLPTGLAVAVSILFFFTFWDRQDVEKRVPSDEGTGNADATVS